MKYIVLAIAFLLAPVASFATTPVTVTVSWVNATANTDGSPFNAATDQKGVTIDYGTTAGGPYQYSVTSAGAGTSYSITLPATCGKTFYFVAHTIANDGAQSAASAQASKVLPLCPVPLAPTGVSVK